MKGVLILIIVMLFGAGAGILGYIILSIWLTVEGFKQDTTTGFSIMLVMIFIGWLLNNFLKSKGK